MVVVVDTNTPEEKPARRRFVSMPKKGSYLQAVFRRLPPYLCPGKEESAEQNHSGRSAKGNKYLRRVLNQAAYAAVATWREHLRP
jgi:transposase